MLSYLPLLPEIALLIFSLIILMVGVFAKKEKAPIQLLLVLAFLVVMLLLGTNLTIFKLSEPIYRFGSHFVLDRLSFILKIFITLSALITCLYSKDYNRSHGLPAPEFASLVLLSVLGMFVLVSSHHFLTLFLGLELMTLPLYAMTALQRNVPERVEAAMKYFVVGALATGMMLYGISILFGVTKTLDLSKVASMLLISPSSSQAILLLAMVLIMSGIVFKIGAAPFHSWVPDVYQGAPTSVTLFIATAPKIAAFGLIARVLIHSLALLHSHWQMLWMLIALLSMAIGNLGAIVQTDIKRLLAFSSIAHMGYMILGLAAGTPRGDTAALYYMISYMIMTLGAFGILILMHRTGNAITKLRDLAGLNTRQPWLAFLMLLVLFSMAGIPPLVGFMAKLTVLEALIQAHHVWLAVLALLFAVIGSYYYIRVVKIMYFDEPESTQPIVVTRGLHCLLSVNCVLVMVLGVFPGLLLFWVGNIF